MAPRQDTYQVFMPPLRREKELAGMKADLSERDPIQLP